MKRFVQPVKVQIALIAAALMRRPYTRYQLEQLLAIPDATARISDMRNKLHYGIGDLWIDELRPVDGGAVWVRAKQYYYVHGPVPPPVQEVLF